ISNRGARPSRAVLARQGHAERGSAFRDDGDLDRRLDLGGELRHDLELAERLEGLVERDLLAIDDDALRLERGGDVLGGDGAEQAIALADLAADLHLDGGD